MPRRPFISAAAREAGVTSEWGYQQWLATQQRGFTSYREQREILGISLVQALRDRAVESGAMSPNEAAREVGNWYRSQSYKGRSAAPGAGHSLAQGLRKRSAIQWAMDNGLYDYGDDAADDIPY